MRPPWLELERFHIKRSGAAVFEVVTAFVFGELVKDLAAELREAVDGSFGPVAEQFFELRKGKLNGVQIGRVRWQVAKFSPNSLDCFSHASHFMTGEIVHYDKISRSECGNQMLLDPRSKQRPIDGAFDRQRGHETLGSQCA